MDRLTEIETRWAIVVPESAKDKKLRRYAEDDIAWLIAEVRRLRAHVDSLLYAVKWYDLADMPVAEVAQILEACANGTLKRPYA